MDQGNTTRPEPALYNAAFQSYGLPLGVQVSGRHNSQNIHSRGPHIHSKDAYGTGEQDATRASPLRRRISELRPPLGVQVSGRHNSQNIHSRGPHIHSKDAYGSGEHDATRAKYTFSPLQRRIPELRPSTKVYKLVEGITRKIYILEGHTSTQKMRMDQGNTMRPKPALYDAAFLSYGRH